MVQEILRRRMDAYEACIPTGEGETAEQIISEERTRALILHIKQMQTGSLTGRTRTPRLPIMRIFPAVVLLVLTAACGSSRAPVTAEEFTDRAREVAGRWQGSAERAPGARGSSRCGT
ncbi:hypothetical protein ACIBLB_45290 [Streptosporangium canum]|uniref:hypothetical protein n=1 Tax=Streptosporangium canum TaxID=324952 RepID=UPI0037B4ECA2